MDGWMKERMDGYVITSDNWLTGPHHFNFLFDIFLFLECVVDWPSFADGSLFAVLINKLQAGLVPSVADGASYDLAALFNIADKELGIPNSLDAEAVKNDKVDNQSFLTYLSLFKTYRKSNVSQLSFFTPRKQFENIVSYSWLTLAFNFACWYPWFLSCYLFHLM